MENMKAFRKRNAATFSSIWNDIVLKVASDYTCEHVSMDSGDKKREAVKARYNAFNEQCSNRYMREHDMPLDRHKVAACIIFAIVAERPLIVDYSATAGTPAFFANERLALKVGYSVVTSFLLKAIGDNRERELEGTPGIDFANLTASQRAAAIDAVENKPPFPKTVGHGDYLTNMVKTLCLTQLEGNYNILLMSSILFHWELNVLPEDCHAIICDFYQDMGRRHLASQDERS